MHRELMMTYLTSQTPLGHHREYHPASPLVDFMVQVARNSHLACQAVLDAGFLDVVLCLYVCNFSCSMMAQFHDVDGKPVILDACSNALAGLCKEPNALTVFSTHPLYILWPRSHAILLDPKRTARDRFVTWRRLGLLLVARRLVALPAIVESRVHDNESHSSLLSEACTDLVEFATQVFYSLPDQYN
jgi:hypothetical protein